MTITDPGCTALHGSHFRTHVDDIFAFLHVDSTVLRYYSRALDHDDNVQAESLKKFYSEAWKEDLESESTVKDSLLLTWNCENQELERMLWNDGLPKVADGFNTRN